MHLRWVPGGHPPPGPVQAYNQAPIGTAEREASKATAPPRVVAPDVVVDAVVEVEVLEMTELGPRRGEELFAGRDVRIHGAAHVEEQQDLHAVATLGNEVEFEISGVPRSAGDRAVHVE